MIRLAHKTEDGVLSDISLLSKSYWNYSQEHMEIFQKELKISDKYITNNKVWVYVIENKIAAYCSIKYLKEDKVYPICTLQKGFWLDHMFVLPEYIKRGIGRSLFNTIIDFMKSNKIDSIQILADPHSKIFYEKMGCTYISEYPSSIKGRTTPYLTFKL
jgi:GNAT superfamily N-acetyltransferase